MMDAILLDAAWRCQIAPPEAGLHKPETDDSDWQRFDPTQDDWPSGADGQGLWLRYHFEMPPNDECVTWWLDFPAPLPDGARLWVNYEAIELAGEVLRWDVTFAVALGDNVVTLHLPSRPPRLGFLQGLACQAQPCEPHV